MKSYNILVLADMHVGSKLAVLHPDTQGYTLHNKAQEPLLYKSQIKWPQVIQFNYEHYAPEPVITRLDGKVLRRSTGKIEELDMEAANKEAQQRLGYDLPKFMEAEDAAPEELGKPEPIVEWENDTQAARVI